VIGQVLDALGVWTTAVMEFFGYPGIFLVLIIENVFPPIPSEVVLPLAGALAARGVFSLPLVVLVAGLGATAGALILYGFGAWARAHGGRRVVLAIGRFAFLTSDDLDLAERWFTRYQTLAVLTGRFVPIVRSLVSIPAGYNHMPLPPFLGLTMIGATGWCALLATAGWFLGDNWEQVRPLISRYEQLMVAAIVVAVAAYVVWKIRSRIRARV
jgi:membrane protein DedA with SNARE-associated domain